MRACLIRPIWEDPTPAFQSSVYPNRGTTTCPYLRQPPADALLYPCGSCSIQLGRITLLGKRSYDELRLPFGSRKRGAK
jgi:hypothetical protein